MEVQSHGLDEQTKVTEGTHRIARAIGAPLAGTNDSHYLEAPHARAHEALLCIQTGTTMSDPNRWRFSTEEFYLKSAEEMREVFKELPEAYSNTLAVAERCNLELTFGEFHLPRYQVPDGLHARLVSRASRVPGAGDAVRVDARRMPWSSGCATSSASSRRWGSPATSSWSGTSSRTRGDRASRSGRGAARRPARWSPTASALRT